MNCKPGDLALVVAGPSANVGKIVRCLELLPAGFERDDLPEGVRQCIRDKPAVMCRRQLSRWLNVFQILRRYHVRPNGDRIRIADGAVVRARVPVSPTLNTLQDRALTFLEAGSTKVMRWFAIAHRFLQRVYHAPGKGRGKLIALLLSVPIFHASDLAFQLSYAINQCRLRRLCRKNGVLGIDDLLIELNGPRLNLSGRMKAHEALGELAHRFHAAPSGSDAA
ncbi:MAG TPA: hypothetical protein VN660_02080 [Steroidobacteraceae bacterium]|nr:hypothetical protein [Steroidobacteraceae bacterium]